MRTAPTVFGQSPALLLGRPARRHGSGARPQRELGGDDGTGHGDRRQGFAGEVVGAGGQFVATDIRG